MWAPIIPLDSAKSMARQINGAKLLVLNGTGHELHDADLPVIEAAITQFLAHVAGTRTAK